MAPQNGFGFDGPSEPPFPFPLFEVLSAIFFFGMLAVLLIRLKIQSLPVKIVVAALGAWSMVATFCAIGLISTLGFADGSEAMVFTATTVVSALIVALAVAAASIGFIKTRLKQKHG